MTRAKIFYHHVAHGHQTLEQVVSFRGLEIQRDGAFIAVDLAVTGLLGSRLGVFGGLHLDDLGAEIRQIAGAIGPAQARLRSRMRTPSRGRPRRLSTSVM
jgi:hypothetical protein